MADYEDKIKEWREVARRKARELDEKYDLRQRVENSTRAASDAARRSAEQLVQEARCVREEAERLAAEAADKLHASATPTNDTSAASGHAANAYESPQNPDSTHSSNTVSDAASGVSHAADDAHLTEELKRAREQAKQEAKRKVEDVRRAAERAGDEARRLAEDAARRARDASTRLSDAARASQAKANQVFENMRDEARHNFKRASKVYDAGARSARAGAAFSVGGYKAQKWVRDHPGQAFLLTLSIVAGIRGGYAFPNADKFLFGVHPHWFTHSALPVYATRKLSTVFDEYLQKREKLLKDNLLSEAERERIEFQRRAARIVGAPLLGAFSCAAGAAMWAQIFKPDRIVGAPISWLLGGNPVLDGIWLFANGVVCFQQGYEFFVIAFRHVEEAEKIVRELRGLLPEASLGEKTL